jgi:integrase/recombinase XerD
MPQFVKQNAQGGNRHLQNSLSSFKKFLGTEYISATDVTENLCVRFRSYLLEKYNGETPSGYFMRFKRVLKAASKDGYFRHSPAAELAAKMGRSKKIKNILSEEYLKLMNSPCLNYEVKKAFVFSLYTGLRWIDVKPLLWEEIIGDSIFIQQNKTGVPLESPVHEIAIKILGARKTGLVFRLPTQDGANKILKKWCDDAKQNKHITWHCAHHSFSVLLQDKGVDVATVAGMLGHTTTKYVHQAYKRYSKNNARAAIQKLPAL